jgi:hypothetical protein
VLGCSEPLVVRFLLAAMGLKRAETALRTIIERSVIYRFVAVDILHPDGLRNRHADLLGPVGAGLPTFCANPPPARLHPFAKVDGIRVHQ